MARRTAFAHQPATAADGRAADALGAAAATDRSGRRAAQHHLPGLLNDAFMARPTRRAGMLAGCATPQPSDYVGGEPDGVEGISLGKNASGENCNRLPAIRRDTVAVFCGTWQQPAARVQTDGATATPRR